jgi:outer membrane protein assembly factor BamB
MKNAHRRFAMLFLLFFAAAGYVASGATRKPPKPPAEPEGVPNDVHYFPSNEPKDVPELRFGTPEKGPGQMTKVTLVATDPEGFVYAGDAAAGRILRFTPGGKPAGRFSVENPAGPLTGLAADRDGILFVANGGRLFRYDGEAGKLLGEVKHPDGAGFFHVAPRPDFGVIASWRNAQRDDFVLVGRDGVIETIHRNAVTGASGEPAGDVLVAMDGRRTIYAAVNRLHAVCIFKLTGEYQNRFGSEGDEDGQFSGAIAGLAVDGQGQIFVSDAKGVNVLKSEDGSLLRRLEVQGTGLAIDDDDALFAAAGTEVDKYRVPPPPEDD